MCVGVRTTFRLARNACATTLCVNGCAVYGWTHVRVPSQMWTDFGVSLANDDYNVIKVTPRTLAT